ncbi:uncharacterized protein LOC143960160 [Lithobates pipiens]
MDRILLGLMLFSAYGFSDTDYCYISMEQITNGFIAKTYMIGTTVKYQCDEGFEGSVEDTVNYACVQNAGKVKWIHEDCCIKENIVFNTAPVCERTANNDSLSNEEETTWTDSCGPPPIVPNATINHSLTDYPLGQELIHSLNGINSTQDEDHEVLKCMNCGGSSMFVYRTDGCPGYFCGPPPIVSNATINHSLTDYPLRQELIHSINGINSTQDGDHEVLKCMNCGGSFMWVYKTDGCPSLKVEEKTETSTKSLHRYIITCTALIIMVMTLVIFGTRNWKEISARKSRNQTKSMKSGSEEEKEEHTTVIHLNENN